MDICEIEERLSVQVPFLMSGTLVMPFSHIGLLILSTPQTLQSHCMRGTSHDGTLRNDRKAELGIANPEIDLGSALTAHKLRMNVSVHVRTAVPHQSVSTRGKKSGHTHQHRRVEQKAIIAIQRVASACMVSNRITTFGWCVRACGDWVDGMPFAI